MEQGLVVASGFVHCPECRHDERGRIERFVGIWQEIRRAVAK
jgi:hypothetical protein